MAGSYGAKVINRQEYSKSGGYLEPRTVHHLEDDNQRISPPKPQKEKNDQNFGGAVTE